MKLRSPKALEKGHCLPLLRSRWLLIILSIPWQPYHSIHCFHCHMVFLPMCVFLRLQISLILTRDAVIGFRAQLNPVWPHLNSIKFVETLFPTKVTFTGSERTWMLEEHYLTQHTRISLYSHSSAPIALNLVFHPHHEKSFPQNDLPPSLESGWSTLWFCLTRGSPSFSPCSTGAAVRLLS